MLLLLKRLYFLSLTITGHLQTVLHHFTQSVSPLNPFLSFVLLSSYTWFLHVVKTTDMSSLILSCKVNYFLNKRKTHSYLLTYLLFQSLLIPLWTVHLVLHCPSAYTGSSGISCSVGVLALSSLRFHLKSSLFYFCSWKIPFTRYKILSWHSFPFSTWKMLFSSFLDFLFFSALSDEKSVITLLLHYV